MRDLWLGFNPHMLCLVAVFLRLSRKCNENRLAHRGEPRSAKRCWPENVAQPPSAVRKAGEQQMGRAQGESISRLLNHGMRKYVQPGAAVPHIIVELRFVELRIQPHREAFSCPFGSVTGHDDSVVDVPLPTSAKYLCARWTSRPICSRNASTDGNLISGRRQRSKRISTSVWAVTSSG